MATFNLVNLMVYDGTSQAAKRMTSGLGAGNTLDFGAGTIAAGSFSGSLSGNASTATKLAATKAFSISGDAAASSVNFDGSADVDLNLVLANSGVTAGQYGGNAAKTVSVTVDAKGRVTLASDLDIAIPHTAITDWAEATGSFLTSADLSSYVQNTRKVLGDNSTTVQSNDGSLSSDVTVSLKSILGSAVTVNDGSKTLNITVDVYGRVSSLVAKDISIAHTAINDWATATQDFLVAADISDKAGLSDTQTFTGSNTFTQQVNMAGGAHVSGALVVDGPIISEGVTNLSVEDAFINLRDGGVADDAGGLVVNTGEADAAVAENGISFVAKAGSTRAYFTTADATTYTGDEVLQIVGSTSNNGFFGVESIEYPAGNAPGGGQGKIYIRTLDIDTFTSVPFLRNNFVSESGVSGATKIRHVNVTVIATSNGVMASPIGTLPLGLPCTASGSHFSDFAPTANGVGGWTSVVPGVVPSSNGVAAVGELLDPSSVLATNVVADSRYAVEFVAKGGGLVHSGRGLPVRVKLADDVSSVSKGEMLYLGTAGRAIKAAPTANGTVVVEIGRASKNKYSDGTVLVWFNPKIVIFNEAV